MNKNNTFITDAINPTNQFINPETMDSLQDVTEKIQHTTNIVEDYKNKVESIQPPIVNGEPWYKLPFGKASVNEVNKAMQSFSDFVQETFKMVAFSQKLQNENDMNICRLIGLLALAEANTYSKINDLTTEDENSVKQLKKLEEAFLQSIKDTTVDNSKKDEQMRCLIEYVTRFAENKTKKIRTISLSLSDVKNKLDKYCELQDKWIDDCRNNIEIWQHNINSHINEVNNQLENYLHEVCNNEIATINEKFLKLNLDLEQSIKEQQVKIIEVIKKQNEKIEINEDNINEQINNYRIVIENQNNLIVSQSESIKNQDKKIEVLQNKNNIIFIIAISALLIAVGTILYCLLY